MPTVLACQELKSWQKSPPSRCWSPLLVANYVYCWSTEENWNDLSSELRTYLITWPQHERLVMANVGRVIGEFTSPVSLTWLGTGYQFFYVHSFLNIATIITILSFFHHNDSPNSTVLLSRCQCLIIHLLANFPCWLRIFAWAVFLKANQCYIVWHSDWKLHPSIRENHLLLTDPLVLYGFSSNLCIGPLWISLWVIFIPHILFRSHPHLNF